MTLLDLLLLATIVTAPDVTIDDYEPIYAVYMCIDGDCIDLELRETII